MAEVQFYSAPGRKRLKPITQNPILYLSIPAKELLKKLNSENIIANHYNDNNNSNRRKKNLQKMIHVKRDDNISKHRDFIVNLPKVQSKRMFIFGDIVTFIKRYEQYHLSVIYSKIRALKKRYEALKISSTVLREKNISYTQFKDTMIDSCNIMKREIGFKNRCEVIQLVKYIPKIFKLILFNKLKENKKTYINSVIKIQKHIRGHNSKIKFMKIKESIILIVEAYERHYITKRNGKAILIQTNYRRKMIQNKHRNQLKEIQEYIRHEKNKKEYERKRDLMNRKRKSVRVIERYWNIVLENRYQKQLEEQISKMSPDCRELYRKFLLLRRETRNLKRDLAEFSQKEAKKG